MIFAKWRVPCYFHPAKKVEDLDKTAGLVQDYDLLGHNISINDFAACPNAENINKMASSSIPKILNYPQMTFLFYKTLIISVLYHKV